MAVLRRVCDDQPRSVRSVNPEVPAWLAGAIEKLHAKKPADRFQTAAEVADLFEKCLAHLQQPDTIALPGELSRLVPATQSKRRRPARSAAVILLVLVVGSLLGLGWPWLADQLPENSEIKNAPPENISRQKVDVTVAKLPNSDERSLETQVNWLRFRAATLDADLTQPAVEGFGDPMDALLGDTRRLLEALERDLTTKKP